MTTTTALKDLAEWDRLMAEHRALSHIDRADRTPEQAQDGDQ